jgi:murein L,D-transpeptidase YafK
MWRFWTIGALIAGIALGATLSGNAIAGSQVALWMSAKADRVVVLKTERKLILMQGDDVLRVYRIALGRYPSGPKRREGDARTPEGAYTLDFKLKDSKFYKAIRVSYPNEQDISLARDLGVDPGGKIMIHGLPNQVPAARVGHPMIDWTQGCIAVTNSEMDEIWGMIDPGTPIEIHP